MEIPVCLWRQSVKVGWMLTCVLEGDQKSKTITRHLVGCLPETVGPIRHHSQFQGVCAKKQSVVPLNMSSAHLTNLRQWALASPPAEWVLHHLRDLLIGALRQGSIPQHVAFVMDGNRRYAREHKIETVEGHHLGFEALARVRPSGTMPEYYHTAS